MKPSFQNSSPLNQERKKSLMLVFAVVVLLLFSALWSFIQGATESDLQISTEEAWSSHIQALPKSKVVRVVDGDTIILKINGKSERARLIGIDAPESVHSDERRNTEEGRQASAYLKELLEGKQVSYEFDEEEKDTHGRWLAYIYLDELFINRHLVEVGHAKAKSYPPNLKYQEWIRGEKP